MFQDNIETAKLLTTKYLQGAASAPLKKYYAGVMKQQQDMLGTVPPTRHEETWKYVDLKFLQKTPFNVARTHEPSSAQFNKNSNTVTLRIANTSETAKWSLRGPMPQGLELTTKELFAEQSQLAELVLGSHWTYDNYFSRLNRALNGSNIFVVVKRDFDPKTHIEIVFDEPADQNATHFFNSQLVFVMEPGAEATVLERLFIKKNYLFNSGVDYFLADNSKLSLLKVEKGQVGGWNCHTARYNLGRDAKLFSTTATIGSSWTRHNVFVELNAEGAQADMLATYLAEGEQFVDHHTAIEHKAGHTTSLQKYTGVLADKAKAVFNGQVKIDRYAQKSSAVQINRNLLLSKTAEINTKPELQIDADDVQAKHGATVGQIQADELFYLQSRGIPENKARTMLTRGFIEEIGLLQPDSLRPIFFKEVSGFLDKVSES